MSKLKNKVAVITGGNSGIGFATAELFLAEGAEVIITGRNERAVGEAVKKLGVGAHGIVSDAGSMSDLQSLDKKVTEICKKIDTLILNAGVFLVSPFNQMTEEIFDANVDINLKGAFFTAQKLVPMMNDGGSIVFVSSIVAHLGLAGSSAYSASKAGVLSLGKTLAVELAPRNIRVNTISPGPINTPIFEKIGMSPEALQEMAKQIVSTLPLKRFGEPKDIAQAALFLASNDSGFMTGSEVTVDGGKRAAF